MGEFDQDIKYAAQSDPAFDQVNAKAIADMHGDDPKSVLTAIKWLRIELNKKNKGE